MRRLILVDTLRRVHKVGFLAGRLKWSPDIVRTDHYENNVLPPLIDQSHPDHINTFLHTINPQQTTFKTFSKQLIKVVCCRGVRKGMYEGTGWIVFTNFQVLAMYDALRTRWPYLFDWIVSYAAFNSSSVISRRSPSKWTVLPDHGVPRVNEQYYRITAFPG